jgi:hypothetical protein
MRRPEQGLAEGFVEAVCRLIWGLRIEILLCAVPVALGLCAGRFVVPFVGVIVGAGAVIAAALTPKIRRILGQVLFRSRVRRQWHRGLRTAQVSTFEPQLPSVVGIERLPAGERLDLRVPFGSCVADLEKAAEVVAAALGVREVRVRRDPSNASRADVTVIRRDPL